MKVFMTGVSGYVARVTLPYLLGDDEIETVRGVDVRPPGIEHRKFEYIQRDVRDDGIDSVMRGMDVAAHLAFVVTEIRDKKKIYDINVNGTRRVLEGLHAAGVKRFLLTSSVSAYGSWPGRDKPISEDAPLKGNENAYYSHTKHLVEKMVDAFEKENPGVTVTRLRPSILCGAHTDNFFLDLLRQRVIGYPGSNPEGLPLVHEDDVGKAFHLAIKKGVPGAFNIAGGNLSFQRIAEILGKPALRLPYPMLKLITDIGFPLGLAPISSHWMALARYPFHINCDKAKAELGWAPRRTPEEAFREMVAAWKKK